MGVSVGKGVEVGDGTSEGVHVGVSDGISVAVGVGVEGRNGVKEGAIVGVRVGVAVRVGVMVSVTINGVRLGVGERGVPVIVIVAVSLAVTVAVGGLIEAGASIKAMPPTQ